MLSWCALLVVQACLARANDFHHKARHAAAVLNKTLIIDGGELATWNGQGTGYANSSNITNTADLYTYSIDLSQSWTNASVKVNQLQKNAPVLQSAALWNQPSNQGLYLYNGGVSLAGSQKPSIPPNQLWSFTLRGTGNGWDEVNTPVSSLRRTVEGAYASGKDLGFALGGKVTAGTADIADGYYVSGMVVYNMTSNQWYNVSTEGKYQWGSSNGAAHFAPELGPVGLFFAFSGDTPHDSVVGMNQAVMYDHSTRQWKTQQTSGDVPAPVRNPCVVGLPGDNGTYEIFFYGGTQTDGRYATSDGSVYVLTLPAFRWLKSPATVPGRFWHTCSIAGQRQMINVGGIVASGPLDTKEFSVLNAGAVDPWPQGVGVFDLSNLQWKSEFDPDAAAYVTPSIVKGIYEQGGQFPTQIDDSQVKSWFQNLKRADSTTANQTTPANSTSAGSNRTDSQPTSRLSAGAIAGIVIGIVAVLLIVAIAGWLLWRRLRRSRQAARASTAPTYSEGEGEYYSDIKPTPEPPRGEMYVNPYDTVHHHEAAGAQIHELDVNHHDHELQGDRPRTGPKT